MLSCSVRAVRSNRPTLIFVSVLDESPRWLWSRGQNDKASRILHKICRINKRQIPSHLRLRAADTVSMCKMSFLLASLNGEQL